MADTAPASAVPTTMTTSNKRDRTSSPADAPSPKENRIGSSPAAQVIDTLPENEPIEADDGDSAFGDGSSTNGTSVRSSTIRGFIENGRRYATLRGEGEVYLPSDDKQFEVFENTHLTYLILDSQRRNVLFQSPISEKAQYVLDIGTGDASWAIDVADKFPNLTVHGVDLYPPPHDWVPPNCILEVDDITKPWTWNKKFDLINIRFLLGSFSLQEWKNLYRQAYDNLQPGGWIEHLDTSILFFSDDGTLPPDSNLAKYHDLVIPCGNKANKPLTVYDNFQQWIEEAGFINVHKADYKVPCGDWPRLQVYKDAGRVSLKQLKAGLEGWMMLFLTKHGDPEPWTPEQVQVYLASMRRELDSNWHIYQKAKRVWAQKPYDAPKAEQKVEVENVSDSA